MERYDEITKDLEQTSIVEYQDEYSETGLFDKITANIKKIGYKLLYIVLTLYFTVKDNETPKWAKTVIYGALGYFILPVDAIPDLMPVVGYTDDLWALAGALGMVALYVKDIHKEEAKQILNKWFKSK